MIDDEVLGDLRHPLGVGGDDAFILIDARVARPHANRTVRRALVPAVFAIVLGAVAIAIALISSGATTSGIEHDRSRAAAPPNVPALVVGAESSSTHVGPR